MSNESTTKLYSGPATVVSVSSRELASYQQGGLTDAEIAMSFVIEVNVEFPGDNGPQNARIDYEFSPRECKGKSMAGKIQREVSTDGLERAKLIVDGDPATVFDAAGKQVDIYQKETTSAQGKTYINTYIGSSARELTPEEMKARAKAMFGAGVASQGTKIAPVAKPASVSADDPDPFG